MDKYFLKMIEGCRSCKLLLVSFAIMLAAAVNGQQIPLFNASLFNPFIENAAMAGENKYGQCFLDYRKQWADIEGSPESTLFTIDWPLNNEKSGLGVIISSDRTNIIGQTGILAAYSHSVNISSDQSLRFGLALKLNQNTIYFDKINVESEYESVFFNYFESATGVNANFGMAYRFKNLSAGLSAVNLVNSRLQYSSESDEKELYFQYIPQYLINVNYQYDINSDISLRPEIALRDLQGMPVQLEASLLSTYQKKYSAGVIYRNKNSFGVIASALFYNKLSLSYSYQASLGELKGYGGGTHEITVGYRFYTSHFQEYKNLDEEKVDQLLEFAQKQTEDNKELKKTNEELRKQQEELNAQLKKEKEEINRIKETMLREQENFNNARTEDETSLDELSDDKLKDPTQEVHIILGVFSDIYSAKEFQKSLVRDYKLTTQVLKRKNNQDYIVCVSKNFSSKAELQKELTKLRKISANYNSSDVWIYTND